MEGRFRQQTELVERVGQSEEGAGSGWQVSGKRESVGGVQAVAWVAVGVEGLVGGGGSVGGGGQ